MAMLSEMKTVEELVLGSDVAVGVLGKDRNFLLVPLGPDADIDGASALARKNGFAYCGVFGVFQGKLETSLCPDNPDAPVPMLWASMALARIFATRIVESRVRTEPHAEVPDDSAEWLESLHALTDDRINTGTNGEAK